MFTIIMIKELHMIISRKVKVDYTLQLEVRASEDLQDNVCSTVILTVFCLCDSEPEKLVSLNCISTYLSTRL